MSGAQLGALGGQLIGASLGPIGAAIGGAIGGAIGNALDPVEPPKLADRTVQISAYGANIPILIGANRSAGNLIWSTPLIEDGVVGGKGGPTGAEQQTYKVSCAFLLARNPQRGLRKVWANKTLIYDETADEDIPQAGDFSFQFYYGDEEQLPDPTMEAHEGVGNVSPMRGYSYVVLTDYNLGVWGNRLPQFEWETVSQQEWEVGTPESWDDGGIASGINWAWIFYRPDGQMMLLGGDNSGGDAIVQFADPITKAYGATYTLPTAAAELTMATITDAVYAALSDRLFVAYVVGGLDTHVAELDALTGELVHDYRVAGTNSPFLWPSGNPGAYLGYDHVNHGVNVIFASQFVTRAMCRIDLHWGLIGYSNQSVTSQSVALADGGEYVQIALRSFGFQPFAIAPQALDGRTWPLFPGGGTPTRNVDIEVITETVDGVDVTVENAAPWHIGGVVTTASFCRAAFDSNRRRYLVIDSAGNGWIVPDADPIAVSPTALGSLGISGLPGTFTLIHMAGLDAFVIADGAGRIGVVSAEDYSVLVPITIALPDASGGLPAMRASRLEPGSVMIAGRTLLADPWRIYEQPLYGSTLGAAVALLMQAAGYEASDYDVSALTQPLRGFAVSSSGDLGPALEQLMQVFQFGASEQDDKIVFRLLGGASAATFTSAELIVESPEDRPLEQQRAEETSLPREITLTAPDPVLDYQGGAQLSQRLSAGALDPRTGTDVNVQVAVVLRATETKRAVDAMMSRAHAERLTANGTLPPRALPLVPVDVITIDAKRWRIASRTIDQLAVKVELVGDDDDIRNQQAIGAEPQPTLQTLQPRVVVQIALLYAPLLRDDEAQAHGNYFVMWQVSGAALPGGTLFGSLDGVSYQAVGSVPGGIPGAGIADALPEWAGGNEFDEVNSITVNMRSGVPTSTTAAQIVASGANPALLGREMLHYRDVEDLGGGVYRLSGLLRGRRGTEAAAVAQADVTGQLFVMLDAAGIGTLTSARAAEGQRMYLYATASTAVSQTQRVQSGVIESTRLKPRAPVHLRGIRNVDGDLVIDWMRRARVSGPRGGSTGVVVPLDEQYEQYRLQIHAASGGALKRTVTVTPSAGTQPAYTYTAADQTTDFGAPTDPGDVDLRVQQWTSNAPAYGYQAQAIA